ncbi:hypothetical protein [Streptomyces sp. NPDC047525]|uniref:hypothetical protein n=1 Tax=Streptomyces sp. NPDC047525 TaxID=3155264 RepID=UPI0033F1182C
MPRMKPDPVRATDAVAHFASVWSSAATGEEVVPALTCKEVDALAGVFRAAGAQEAADAWTAEHTDTDTGCQGHDSEQDAELRKADGNGGDDFAPGDKYSYCIADYADAAALSLGKGWAAKPGFLGAWGVVFTTDGRVSLRLYADGDGDGPTGDLMVEDCTGEGADRLVPSFVLPDFGTPHTDGEMSEWGDALAQFIGSVWGGTTSDLAVRPR